SGAATQRVEAHALGAVLEAEFCEFDLAALRERLPIGFKVIAFESGAADLLGEEAVFDRVIDVLEKLAVDARVDRDRDPVCIDKENRDPGLAAFGGVGKDWMGDER